MNSRMPFSSLSRPAKRTCGGSSGSPTCSGIRHRRRNDLARAGAERARLIREERRSRDDDARAAHERTHERGCTARELDVRPPHLQHVGLARRPRRDRRGDPVRMHQVGVARRTSGCARERRKEQRHAARASTARRAGSARCRRRARPRNARNDPGETTSTSTPARGPPRPTRRRSCPRPRSAGVG